MIPFACFLNIDRLLAERAPASRKKRAAQEIVALSEKQRQTILRVFSVTPCLMRPAVFAPT
jgi:hypothetical protein